MRWLGLCAALLAACSVDVDYERRTIAFDVVSPATPGGGADPIVAKGSTLFTGYISRDDGVTWAQANPAIIINTAQISDDEHMIVNTTAFGWGRWNKTTDQVNTINSPTASIGAIHLRPTGTILLQQPQTTNVHRQTSDGAWTQAPLPVPPSGASPAQPTVSSIESTPTSAYLVSDWGIYRSTDDGASWTYVYKPNVLVTLLPFDDGRVAVMNQNRAIVEVLDANGAQTGTTSPQFMNGGGTGRIFTCMGAIVFGGYYSVDLGTTFMPITPDVPNIAFEVGSTVCGGDYLLVHIKTPSNWLVKISAFRQFDKLYSYTPMYETSGGNYLKLNSGTVLAGNLAWKPGESTWSIRIQPNASKIYVLGDDSLYAYSGRNVYRSTDDGVTWTTTMAPVDLPIWDNVFAETTGTMWASYSQGGQGGDVISIQTKLWRSDDHGVTWMLVWDRTSMTMDAGATSTEPYAPRLLAVASDGTFVGGAYRDGLFLSHDHGDTWTSSPFPPGYIFRYLTAKNHGVTFDDNDTPTDDVEDKTDAVRSFHLWHDYGAGDAFAQVTPLVPTPTMGDLPADLSSALSTLSFDQSGFVWWYGGMPLQGVWKSREPIE